MPRLPPAVDRRTVLGLFAAAGVAAVPGKAFAAPAAGSRPWTIPAIREWMPASGSFRLGTPAVVVIRPGEAAALAETGAVLAADLRNLLGVPALVTVRGGPAKTGEILLRLDAADEELGGEGYRLTLGDAAVVSANATPGVFYGTRSLLQLLVQGPTAPRGTARDWPRYPERGLMIDIGRKHFSYDWLADRVRDCAFLKLNYLQLWFTENLGWRIESEQHPEIVSDQHLTKSQARDLIALAAEHHVTIVSGVDMPGHMGAVLAAHPELALRDALGRPSDTALDVSMPAARRLAFDLVDEYLQLFHSRQWLIGADEYVPAATYPLYPQLQRHAQQRYGPRANAKDAVLGFVNDVNDRIRAAGRVGRIANDGMDGGAAVTVDRDIVVEWWTDFSPLSDVVAPTPHQVLERGHCLHNISFYPTYYSNLPTPVPPKPDLEGMYETWAVHRFRGPLYLDGNLGAPYHDIATDDPRNSGARLSVWNDDPDRETEEQIATAIHPRMRVMAQQTWESPKLAPTYAEFSKIIAAVGAAPGR